MRKNKIKVLFQKTGGDFIDPLDTGSHVRYKTYVYVNKGETPDRDYLSVDFEISLGDCSRVITWDFDDYQTHCFKVDKINTVIKILKKAKSDMEKAEKIATKERARLDKDKKKAKLKVPKKTVEDLNGD